MKRLISILLFILLTASVSTGCNQVMIHKDTNVDSNSNKIKNTSDTDKTNVSNLKDIIKINGVYVGQIDSHSIEIKINGESKAFEIENIIQPFESLNLEEGEGVMLSYVKNDSGQLVINNINRIINTDGNRIIQAEGKYIGQIDSHSIEVNITGELKDFQILDVIKQFNELDLKEGDSIKFSYQKNSDGLLVIKNMTN